MPTETSKPIKTAAGRQFTIEIESNPTTGYQWCPVFSEAKVRLIRHDGPRVESKPGSRTPVGAGGVDLFVFEALAEGETSIQMTLKRVWETTHLEQRTFRVSIERAETET